MKQKPPQSQLEAAKRKVQNITGCTVTHAYVSKSKRWLYVHAECDDPQALRDLVLLSEKANGAVTVYTHGNGFRYAFCIRPANTELL